MIFISLLIMISGPVLYFLLLNAGIYRPLPWETYTLMLIAAGLAWRTAHHKKNRWPYVIVGINTVMLAIFLFWTLSFSKLPERTLPFAVGKPIIPITLIDHNKKIFDSTTLKGKSAALYLFYRGNW